MAENKRLAGRVWWIIEGIFFVNVAFYAVPANVALFMQEQNIGTAQSAGTVISVFMVSGFIAGLILSYIQRFFRKYTVPFGVGMMAGGYTALSFSHGMGLVVIGSGLVGFSFGVLFPSFIILITNRCSAKSCVLALSFSGCSQFMGQFASPYLLQLIKNMLGLSSLRNDFGILAVSLGTVTVVYLVIKQVMKYELTHLTP